MFRIYRRWKKQRAINKVKPGDGHLIKPLRWWEVFTRTIFYKEFIDEDGAKNVYAVDINYFDEMEKAHVYLNGKHHATAKLPAMFPVPGGYFDVALSTYGMKRIHYITEDGTEEILSPHSYSMEGLRLRFEKRYPRASKVIAYTAIAVLLFSIITGFPQLLASLSQIDFIAERFGTFESPIVFPNWLNITMSIAGTLAGR